MRRRALAALLALLLAPPALAEDTGYWLGVVGGYGWPKPEISTQLPILKGNDSSGGPVAGIMGEGILGQTVSVVSEAVYSRRKVRNIYDGGTGEGGASLGDVTADYTFEYIEVANSLKFAAGSGSLRPYGLAGVVISLPLRIRSVNTVPGSAPLTEDASRQFSSTSWSLDLGAGLDYRIKDGAGIILEGRYLYPLSNSTRSGADTWKWRDWRVMAGIKVRL